MTGQVDVFLRFCLLVASLASHAMHSGIRPYAHVAIRLPSQLTRIIEIAPNTNINIGKFGTFSSNQIIGRPYYITYEILEKEDGASRPELRVVSAAELHAEALGSDQTVLEDQDEDGSGPTESGFDIVGIDGEVIMRNNRVTIDDPSRQTLSMEEIEELKRADAGSGKEIIAKIMAAHMGIDEKTSFSLAKYTLRKSRKYLKRFTVLPLDVGTLADHIREKEGYRTMELREETLGLICSWANVYNATNHAVRVAEDAASQVGGGRWLVVDDTGGLVTAALAEKMGILYPLEQSDETSEEEPDEEENLAVEPFSNGAVDSAESVSKSTKLDISTLDANNVSKSATSDLPEIIEQSTVPISTTRTRKPKIYIPQMSAKTNTLTILHSNNQPNVSNLKYFGFDTGDPSPSHPLYTHFKSLSWLQLLHPEEDPSYIEPDFISEEVLASMKSSKRGNYYKKRRRWEKVKSVVHETRNGGFDGLVVATSMDAKGILAETVPLVKGGGKVVVYSPNVEPLVELCDYYSKDRRAAYIARESGRRHNGKTPNRKQSEARENYQEDESEMEHGIVDENFPVNPTFLLAPSVQTVRARHWQVLPQRTHPFMTSKGGAEGYLFTATRVIPVEGRVEARGTGRGKRRKTGLETSAPI